MEHTFAYRWQRGTQRGTEENAKLVPGRGVATLNATWYKCHKPGHHDYHLTEASRTNICSLHVIHIFAQNQIQKNEPINDNWILLDTCSSVSVMKNVYLENIQNCNTGGKVLMLTNGGHLSFSQMRSLLLLPMIVHMNESSMVNILFFRICQQYGSAHQDGHIKGKGRKCSQQRKFFSFQRVFSKQILMNQAWSLILVLFLLTPSFIYPQ